ncbi:BamA/TamA family outer membrane protein [Sphingopyxis sp. SE2]|uniref:autotransporter assembly complex protein TamA n=1 Tax=unclassified Sphingopyxis TaxID=2614943 RepID=UPI00050FDFCB|nr:MULTISPECIES: BamA/TamA family outer membrane protein [unclassified Sphingopyxis]KGB53657.1 Surface antigen (D15) precursor [Sphingopyxis sp. LC363]MDT7527898.1 BamA/TamA family outer membrane protein [Sphingopyxis sp. SE2]
MRPLLIGATSLIGLAWAGAAQAQDVAPPKVVPTLDADSAEIAAPSPPPPEAQLPAVEPIIEDEEFEKSIPPISAEDDAELDRPIESIAEFERRLVTEAANKGAADGSDDAADATAETQPPQVDGVPVPALADGDAAEVIGDAPISDSELAAPLPPLENFDVEPVEFAEAEADSDNVELSYTVQVNGLSDADDSTDVDLADVFGDLSALYGGDGKADNAAMIRARLSADGELMQRILASEGYYDAVVDTRIDRGAREEGQERQRRPITAVIDVKPGKRYTLADIIINADPTIPPNLIADNFPLSVGEPIVAQRIQGAEAAIALKLPEEGYPFAKVGQRDILLDGATGDGVYTLPVDIGKRSRFGGIETTGDLAFDAEHVEVLARFKRGDLYDSRMVDDLRQALVATGLFATVAAEPQPTGESAGDDTEYVTMLVTQQAGPPRTIAASAGYGTGEGIRLEGSWTHRNLLPPEGALTFRGVLGTQEQGIGATLRRSNAGRRDRTLELVTEVTRSTYDAFNAITGRVGARVSYDSTPIWQKKFTYAYGVELIATREDDYDFATGDRSYDFYTILGLTGQVGMDRTDSLLDPTKGFRITSLIQPEGSLAGRFSPYARLRTDISGYYPVTDSIVLAGRVRVGSIVGAARERLAPSRRFYAGGGGSVRGFGFQELGPKDPNNDPIGGRSVNEVALEARYRFGNFGVVGFVDGGQVYRSSAPTFQNLRFGAGIGARYYTNFGPMRFDIATPIGRKPGEARVSVYVSIGQAF